MFLRLWFHHVSIWTMTPIVRLRLARLRSNLRRQLQEAVDGGKLVKDSTVHTGHCNIAIPLNSECIEPWTEASAVEQAVTLMAGNEDDEAQLFHAISAIFASKPVLKTCYQHLSVSRHIITTQARNRHCWNLDHLMSFLPSLLISYDLYFPEGSNSRGTCAAQDWTWGADPVCGEVGTADAALWGVVRRFVVAIAPESEWTVWQQFWELHHVHHKPSPSWLSEAHYLTVNKIFVKDIWDLDILRFNLATFTF